MNNVNKTLYIPLYGKALVSRKAILLQDRKAEEIWDREGFPLKGKAASKWLAYYMGMRSAVFDRWTLRAMEADPNAIVVHIGCGLDSRCLRLGTEGHSWYDIDFPEVIRERQRFFSEDRDYHMIAADMRADSWKTQLPAGGSAIIVMEGVSMYFGPEELENLLKSLNQQYETVSLLMDCYSVFAAKVSKYKNPINEVGVTAVYGIDAPGALAEKTGLCFVREHDLTPLQMIAQLSTWERIVFSNVYAGKMARKLYRLYEFKE